MPFDNIEYPLGFSKLDVDLNFQTTIIIMDNGAEDRNSNWDDSLLKFDAGTGIQSTSTLSTLISFFRARKGAGRGFLLKDYTDFQATNQACTGTANGTNPVFYLNKTYTDSGNTDNRPIVKPKSGTIQIYVNASLKTEGVDYDIDYTIGKVTFRGGHIPPNLAAVTWNGEFFVPVRFESDTLRVGLLLYKITSGKGESPQVLVVETRDYT
jgi:uncharacterized protein (TIGR02217 family)